MEQSFTQITRPVSRDAKTGQFVLAAFFLGILGAGSFIAGLMYIQPLYLAITFGAVLAGWMLFDRKRHHDGLHTIATTRTGVEPPPQEPTRPEIYSNEDGVPIKLGRYRLRPEQWANLAKVIFDNDDRFVRDVIAMAKVFDNITAPGRWNDIKKDFERMGLVIDGQLTNTGREYFSNYSPYPRK